MCLNESAILKAGNKATSTTILLQFRMHTLIVIEQQQLKAYTRKVQKSQPVSNLNQLSTDFSFHFFIYSILPNIITSFLYVFTYL
jgi:hypothetical protein